MDANAAVSCASVAGTRLGSYVGGLFLSGCAAPPPSTDTGPPRGGGHYEVHHYEDRIVVTADIQIYGEGASPEVAQRYEQAIERVWNNKREGFQWNDEVESNVSYRGTLVVFDVNVYYQEPSGGWKRNLIGEPVRPERGEDDALNMIFVEPGLVPEGLHPYLKANDGSYDWDWGVWWADMDEYLIAHEAGHVFGLPDYYGPNGRPVDAAYHDWIMANPNGWLRPGTGEIDEIIETAKYQYFH